VVIGNMLCGIWKCYSVVGWVIQRKRIENQEKNSRSEPRKSKSNRNRSRCVVCGVEV
jgi:hypothetical protein